MHSIPLYSPYIFVRRSDWLRAAALYWPKLAVLRPAGFEPWDDRQGDVALALRKDLDFFVDIDPAPGVLEASAEFLDFLKREEGSLRSEYGSAEHAGQASEVDGFATALRETIRAYSSRSAEFEFAQRPDHDPLTGRHEPDSGFVMASEMSRELRSALVDCGLAHVPGDFDERTEDPWLNMHPRLATTYTHLLLDKTAKVNDLALITDQAESHMTANGSLDLRDELLEHATSRPFRGRSTEQAATAYAMTAVQAVVPDLLQDIPVEKIITARRKLAEQFDAFRAHLDGLSQQFAELAPIADPVVLQTRLDMLVQDQMTKPRKELEHDLRLLGLQPVQALMSLKTLTPSAVAAAISGVMGMPAVVTATGTAAVCLLNATATARRESKAKKQSAPGYLLGLSRTLTPRSLATRSFRIRPSA